MKIKINSEAELFAVAAEAIHWLVNVRASETNWKKYYGADMLDRKKYYEAKADAFIERLNVPEHRNLGELKIEISPE